jgi:hypothetical protein
VSPTAATAQDSSHMTRALRNPSIRGQKSRQHAMLVLMLAIYFAPFVDNSSGLELENCWFCCCRSILLPGGGM